MAKSKLTYEQRWKMLRKIIQYTPYEGIGSNIIARLLRDNRYLRKRYEDTLWLIEHDVKKKRN